MKTIKFKIRHIFAALLLAYIAYGLHRCHEEGDVVRLEFNESNPTEYDFPFSIDSVARALVAIDKDDQVFTYHIKNQDGYSFRFYNLGKHYNAASYVYVYRKNFNEHVQEDGDFIVTLDSLNSDSTRVIIRRDTVTVGYGVRMFKGPTFKYYWIRYSKVSTPAIQEYDFLRLLGRKLGCMQQMPLTKYPKELSQRQILERLNGRPGQRVFTAAEVFGAADSSRLAP